MSITATEAAPNSTWRLEVESAVPDTFTPVAGLNSFSPTPAYTTADNSDFNSGMWGSDLPTQMKMTIAATFIRRNDGSAYDAGQELLREAAYAADLVRIRYYDTAFDAAESYEADAYVQWSPQGGGTTGIQTVNVTLNVQGAPAEVANPAATP